MLARFQFELRRDQVLQAAVGTYLVVVIATGFDQDSGFAARAEPSMDRHSSRSLPLKLSSVPFCQGLPGSLSTVAMPGCAIHSRMAWLTNSGRCPNA